MENICDIYITKIPNSVEYGKLYPEERDREVAEATCEEVKAEKYCAWKLLEFACKKSFNLSIKEIEPKLNDNGKWVSKKLHFSLSHTKGYVAVGVSNKPVGVDMELKARKIGDKVKEKFGIDDLSVWTAKESKFKMLDRGVFKINELDIKDVNRLLVNFCGEEIYLSVACEGDFKLFNENGEETGYKKLQ